MNEATTEARAPSTRARRLGLSALLVYAVLLCIGLASVLLREPSVATPAKNVTTEDLNWAGDLARWDAGAIARASSYHNRGQHFPVFAIDGKRDPGHGLAKWTSWPDDRAPWLAVDLAAPTDVDRVSIAHAGIREHPRYNIRDYQLVCMAEGRELKRQAFTNRESGLVTHDFDCEAATTIRFEWSVGPREGPTGVARIYEIDVRGRPAR